MAPSLVFISMTPHPRHPKGRELLISWRQTAGMMLNGRQVTIKRNQSAAGGGGRGQRAEGKLRLLFSSSRLRTDSTVDGGNQPRSDPEQLFFVARLFPAFDTCAASTSARVPLPLSPSLSPSRAAHALNWGGRFHLVSAPWRLYRNYNSHKTFLSLNTDFWVSVLCHGPILMQPDD